MLETNSQAEDQPARLQHLLNQNVIPAKRNKERMHCVVAASIHPDVAKLLQVVHESQHLHQVGNVRRYL